MEILSKSWHWRVEVKKYEKIKKKNITKTTTKHQSTKLQGGMKRKQQQQQWRHESILSILVEVQFIYNMELNTINN